MAAPRELVQGLLEHFPAHSAALRASWMKPALVPRGWSCGGEAAQGDVLHGAAGSLSERCVLLVQGAELC